MKNNNSKISILNVMMRNLAPKIKDKCDNIKTSSIFITKEDLRNIRKEKDEYLAIGMVAKYGLNKNKTMVFKP